MTRNGIFSVVVMSLAVGIFGCSVGESEANLHEINARAPIFAGKIESAIFDASTDTVQVSLWYSGGAREHSFGLRFGSCAEVYPLACQADLLHLTGSDDPAEAYLNQTVSLSLNGLPGRAAHLTIRTASGESVGVYVPESTTGASLPVTDTESNNTSVDIKTLMKPCPEIYAPAYCEIWVGRTPYSARGSNSCEAQNLIFSQIHSAGASALEADLRSLSCTQVQ